MSFRILTTSIVTGLFLLTGIANLSAHEGGHHDHSNTSTASRIWSIAHEGMHLHGSFVSATGGQVQIRRADGKLTNIAIDRVIAADQTWIKNRLNEIKQLNRQHGLQLVAIHQPPLAMGEAKAQDKPMPEIGKHFKAFEKSLHAANDEIPTSDKRAQQIFDQTNNRAER